MNAMCNLNIRRCVLLLAAAAPLVAGEEVAAQQARLGINLSEPRDGNTERPFVDVFRLSRKWISQRGAQWGKGPPLELDEQGWVTSLEPGCRADTVLCAVFNKRNARKGHYPSGRYTILYDGRGRMNVRPQSTVVSQRPGRVVIDVDSSQGNFFLQILETDPDDYIRNIRVVMPGFEETYRENPWHPGFLARWKGFACIRFMDFMHTNGSEIETWEDRPQMDDSNWSKHGVPLEMMCDLVNRVGCDAWFCMPHKADDNYVRQFARQAKALLDPERKVYIEYSNEVWNSNFSQYKFAAAQGQKLGFADKPWQAAWRYTAYRSKQIFKIWEEEFGDRRRLVRVLPSQAAVPAVSKQVLSFEDAYRGADALAIAPYFSMNVRKNDADGVVARGLDALLDEVESRSLPKAIGAMRAQKAVADSYGVKLIAYESGQHLVGILGAENNEELTDLLLEANRHPRMGEFYRRYYDAWDSSGGDLMCAFNSVAEWSKWGSWGLLEFADQSPASSPKFQATLEWAARHGQPVNKDRR
jgi:hypothetical protein